MRSINSEDENKEEMGEEAYQLGMTAIEKKDFKAAESQYKVAVDCGHIEAHRELARLYLKKIYKKSFFNDKRAEANVLLLKAAKADDSESMRMIAYQLVFGHGVPINLEEASYWYSCYLSKLNELKLEANSTEPSEYQKTRLKLLLLALVNNSTLMQLTIKKFYFDQKGIKLLVDALKHNSSLTNLTLEQCQFDGSQMKPLIDLCLKKEHKARIHCDTEFSSATPMILKWLNIINSTTQKAREPFSTNIKLGHDIKLREDLRRAYHAGDLLAPCYLGLMYEYGLAQLPQSEHAALFFYERADSRFPLRQFLLGIYYLREFKRTNGFASTKAAELFNAAARPVADYQSIDYHDLVLFLEKEGCDLHKVNANLFLAIVYTGCEGNNFLLKSMGPNETLSENDMNNAQDKNMPILMKQDSEFSIYGEINGSWHETKLVDLHENERDSLNGVDFDNYLLDASRINDVLTNILKKGHIYTGCLLGIAKNKDKSAYFFEQVAQYADPWTQCNIGMLYEDGFLVHDCSLAEKWYRLAANKGLARAQRNLSALYRSGKLGYQNEPEAEKLTLAARSPKKKLTEAPIFNQESLPYRSLKQLFRELIYSSKETAELFGIQSEHVPRVRALYDWEADRDDRLSIYEGDILFLLYKNMDWWHCENPKTHEEGKVPSNFVVELPMSSSSHFDISRMDLPANAVKISLNSIVFEKYGELGEGAYGKVSRAKWLDIPVAVKQTSANYICKEIYEDFWREINVMSQLRHPNIVLLHAYTGDTPVPYLLMEYMDRGTLFEHLGGRKEEEKDIFLPWPVRYNIAINVATGLSYLHSVGLVHRDLKSNNILLCHYQGNPYFAKISDFGLSNFCRDETVHGLSLKTLRSDSHVGTIKYMAPELLRDKVDIRFFRYNSKTDIYSYAIILWELITHAIPYLSGKFSMNSKILSYVRDGGREIIPSVGVPAVFSDLTRRAWSQKPEDRPTLAEIIKILNVNKEPEQGGSDDSPKDKEDSFSQYDFTREFAIGPLNIPEFELEDIQGKGSSFYEAIILQMRLTQRRFLERLCQPTASASIDNLRKCMEGEDLQCERIEGLEHIFRLAERTNSIVAIIDTRHPQLGFCCYFINRMGERESTYHAVNVPLRPIIRLAFTGNCYLSVTSHPMLYVGGLRSAFDSNGEWGSSLPSSSVGLHQSQFGFVSNMNPLSRGTSLSEGSSSSSSSKSTFISRSMS